MTLQTAFFTGILCFSLIFVSSTTPGYAFQYVQDDEDTEEVDQPEGFEEEFDHALRLYEEAEYIEAARAFSKLEGAEATLFAGKSYFAAGHYALANRYLQRITSEAPEEIYLDARFTLALSDYKAGNFGRSLDLLYGLNDQPEISEDASELYISIQHFLNKNQRKAAFNQSGIDSVRYDILEYALEYNSPKTVESLIKTFNHSFDTAVDSSRIEQITAKKDSVYEERGDTVKTAPAPPGTVYNIGVPLPAFDTDDDEYPVARGLYYGILKAAQQFNERNEDRKISLYHADPTDPETPESVMDTFSWNHHIDLMIGPLFSESAYAMSGDAENYGITMVPPLANSDSLNLDNAYVYQPNPTFAKRGKALARFAVDELEMDTLAVISETDTQGMEEAYAFREEAERLGAKVIHFFQDRFVERGYDVSDYTPHFAGDENYLSDEEKEDVILRDIDGLFLAFTGRGARTLIDLVMTDLEATRAEMDILGSTEMSNMNFSERRLNAFDIYYMDSMHLDESDERVQDFSRRFEEYSGFEPNQFAYLGYDVADFLFQTLEEHPNPANLKRVIRDRERYEGLILNIAFANSHINSGMNFFQLTPDGAEFQGERDLEYVLEDFRQELEDDTEDEELEQEN